MGQRVLREAAEQDPAQVLLAALDPHRHGVRGEPHAAGDLRVRTLGDEEEGEDLARVGREGVHRRFQQGRELRPCRPAVGAAEPPVPVGGS